MRRTRLAVLAVLPALLATPAAAAPYRLLFETDADAGAGSEAILRTYPTLADLIANTSPADEVLPINISAAYSIAGFTYDGQYRLLFETDADSASSEAILRTYSTLADLIANISPADDVLPINISAAFSIAGLTYDGQYRLLFETDADTASSEVILRTYPTLADLIANTSPADEVLPINISGAYSIAGFTYDGQYRLLFETDADTAGSEVILRTYPTLADLIANTSPADEVLPINIAAAFSIAGFLSEPSATGPGGDPGAIPEPATLALLGFGLAGLAAARRRKAA